ncbi:S41 family peptidase [Aurantiacibacter hainanensis]|uniref:S41 family peptidase n=1 Tax=Aurantiacibacter hainanensis TaxID=3076114 RepID=UPI0030C69FC2
MCDRANGEPGSAAAGYRSGRSARTRGVWQSDANGWILEIDDAGIARWQDTPDACYRADQGGTAAATMGQIEYRLITLLDGNEAIFRYLDGDTPTRFRRIESLPPRCTPTPPASETAIFDTFAAIMDRHYGFFDERGVVWDDLVARNRSRVRDGMGDAALFTVMEDMVEALGDSHTKLIAEIDGEQRRAQGGLGTTLPMIRSGMGEGAWLRGIVGQLLDEVLDPGASMVANDRIVQGTMAGGRIGYIQVFTMGGFDESQVVGTQAWADAELAAFDAAFDTILAGFAERGVEAVILDLSNNRGGYDLVARRLAGRFTETAYLGYTVTNTGGGEPVPYVIDVPPEPRFAGPVYLLTSDVTVSGGELATLALRQNSRVTQVGGTTRGSFSTPLPKPLPNGWYLELSNEAFTAPDGGLFEGTGIAPHWPAPVFPQDAPVEGHGGVLEWLAGEILARRPNSED